MIASHSCCRFVDCTSMMWVSRSTTSQRCSIGLRSGDCGGHLSKVNSFVMFKKPVWDDLSFVTWCIMLLEVDIRRWVHCSYKGDGHGQQPILRQSVVFKRCSIGTKGPKVCQEILPHPITPPTSSPEPLDKAGWIHAFMFFMPNYDPTIWMSQQKSRTHQTRQRFSNLLLFHFWWALCEL